MITNLAIENQNVRMAHSRCYYTLMVDSARMTQVIINGFNTGQKIYVFLQSVTCHLECRLNYQG